MIDLTRLTPDEIDELRNNLKAKLPLVPCPKANWIRVKRGGNRIRTRLLLFLDMHTSGKVAIGKKYIAFEREDDALMYKLVYTRTY